MTMEWKDWYDLGVISGPPAVATWAENRLDVFARSASGGLSHKKYVARKWDTGWEEFGGAVVGTPAATAWGNGRIDIFVRGTDNKVHHTVYNGQKFEAWDTLGGGISSSPAAAAWKGQSGASYPANKDRIYVFARGMDTAAEGYPWYTYWDGNWQQWDGTALGRTNIIGAPAAVSWGPNRIDLFARWSDNSLRHNVWDGKWSGWNDPTNNLGGVLTEAPAVASWGINRLDVFVRGSNNHLSRRVWKPGGWSAYEDLGGSLASAPAAVSWGPNRVDCFVMGSDKHLYQKILTK